MNKYKYHHFRTYMLPTAWKVEDPDKLLLLAIAVTKDFGTKPLPAPGSNDEVNPHLLAL